MNSAKPFLKNALVLLLAGCLWQTTAAYGEGVPFTVSSGQTASDNTDAQQGSVYQLKYQAVVDWLQRYLGERYSVFQKAVTPEFAERYILDYSVGRNPTNRSQLQVTGHLDSDALKRWVRTQETKNRSNGTLKPFLVVTSQIPGLTIAAGDTAARSRGTGLVPALLTQANVLFAKFNTRVGVVNNPSLSLTTAPRTVQEIRLLREYGLLDGYNCGVWLQVAPCATCNGFRLDGYIYNLTQARLVMTRSEELTLSATDMANTEKVRAALKGPFLQFKTELEEQVSQGTLFAASYRLIIEGVDSYRSYKALETELTKLDFIVRLTPHQIEAARAEFEMLSALTPDELVPRFQTSDFPGFKLKPVRVDSQSLVMRYSKSR